jgi:uncharacterized membrane protein YdbT with pleckstrin-like domain
MTDSRVEPGRPARETFRTGIRVAVVTAVAAACFLYWLDVVTLLFGLFALLVLLPVYLVVVASLLSVWLGFDRTAVEPQPVRRESGTENGEEL